MQRMPSVTIDSRTGVFSVDLRAGQVARTVEFDDTHLVDIDANGTVLSIEVLTPDDPKIQEIAAQYGFGELVPAIHAAIAAACAPQITTKTTSQFRDMQATVRFVGGSLVGTRPAEVKPPPRELTLIW